MQLNEILLYFSLKYEGSWQKIYDAVKNKEKFDEEEFKRLSATLKSRYVTILDDGYPQRLKFISKPPYVLYYYGDLSLLKNNNILAVVGSRDASEYSLETTSSLIKGLSGENVVIVSGLAKGIDTCAHVEALNNDISTIAVLGTGIDECYPKTNFMVYEEIKDRGLLLSEYPSRVHVPEKSFSLRNRILIGLSNFVFAPDVHERSGTLVSIKYALMQGKDIFTIPHPLKEKNMANILIQEGAKLIIDAKDIIEEFR